MEFSPEIAMLQSALALADKLCDGGLLKFDCRSGGDEALQTIAQVISEITRGVQHDISTVEGDHWKLKLAACLATVALRQDGLLPCFSDDISALTAGIPPFGLSLYFEVVKTCGWSEQLTELLGVMERNASENLLLALCDHISSADHREVTDKVDACLLVDMCNFLLLHDNKIIFNSDAQPPYSHSSSEFLSFIKQERHFLPTNDKKTDKTSDSRVLLTELVKCLAVTRLDSLDSERKAVLFLALLNLLSCSSHGHCCVMKQSVVESREFAGSFEAFMMSNSPTLSHVTVCSGHDCHEFSLLVTALCDQPSERLAENVLEILLGLWSSDMSEALWMLLTAETKSDTSTYSSVSTHERCFLASVLLEEHAQLKQQVSMGQMSLDCNCMVQTLSAKLEGLLAPFAEVLLTWMEKKKDMGTASGSLGELDRAIFVIDERLKGYVDCSLWLACADDVKVISDERWLLCIERNLDVFASSMDHLQMLLQRLSQLRLTDMREASDRLNQVVLRIFSQLPVVLRNSILEDVYKVYEPEHLFGVNSDFALQLVAMFNRLVNSNEDIAETLSEVSVLALQSPVQTLQKLVSEAFGNAGQVSLLVKIIQGLSVLGSRPSSEGCSCIGAEVKRAVRSAQSLSSQQQQNLLHCVNLLLQPYTAVSEAAIPYKKEPVLDVAEFLHVCVLPHMNIVPQDDSPSNAVSCNLALALLRVAMETPTLQLCDWAAVVRCHLFPTILCVCSLADVCGSLHEDYAHENLYSVKEMALDVLDLLTRILSRQQSPRMEDALQWLSQRMLSLHWTSQLYLHPLFAGCSNTVPSLTRPLSTMLPASLSSLLNVSASVCQTIPDVPGEPLLLLFEACKTTDASLEHCLAMLRDDVLRCQPSLYASIVTVLVEVLPHCVSTEWTRLAQLLQRLIAKDILSMRERREEQDALVCEGDSCWEQLALSQVLRDVMLVYGAACCRQCDQHADQTCAYVCRGYTDVMKNSCIEVILRGAMNCCQKAICLALCLSDVCTVSTAFTPECSRHLQVIAQETAGLVNVEVNKVKVAEGVKVAERSAARSSVLEHVMEIVRSAVEMVPNEDDRQSLLKAIH